MQPAAVSPPASRRSAGPLVVLSLAINVALAGWLWHTQTEQGSRLARLEAAAAGAGRTPGLPAAAGHPAQAGHQERVAFLLAAAGNPVASRQILAAVSADEAVEIARALITRPAANDRNEALDATLRFLAADDPSRAVALLGGVEESGLKSRLARHVAAVWTATGPEAAARWLTDGGGQFFDARQLSDELSVALARWSAFAPEAAARFIDARPPEGGVQPTPTALALGQACLEWSRRDPAASLAWAQSLASTDPRQPYALDGVIQGWTEGDPAGAAGWVRQALLAAPTSAAGNLAVVVVQAWAAKDPEAAARWSAALPEAAVRPQAMREAAGRWAQADPMSAAHWASGLPADRARSGVWVGLTERWADSDPARAEAWLERLPAGRDRDEATAVYINRLAPTEPEKALTWARTLAGPGFAAAQVRNVLAQWQIKDAAAAQNWAAANGVPLPPLQGGR